MINQNATNNFKVHFFHNLTNNKPLIWTFWKSRQILYTTHSFDLFAGTFSVLDSHLYVTYNRQKLNQTTWSQDGEQEKVWDNTSICGISCIHNNFCLPFSILYDYVERYKENQITCVPDRFQCCARGRSSTRNFKWNKGRPIESLYSRQ